MKKKLMLIDGNSIINRAYYGLPPLQNKYGLHTGGIYGFLTIFFKLYEEENPHYIGVAFDLKAPTFRHEKYENYKSQRKSMPDELRQQLPVLKNLLVKMNIPVFATEGYEADDIMGTLSVKGEEAGLEIVLISGDKDLLQLVTDKVKLRIPKTKGGKTEIEDYLTKDVIAAYGVTPKEYIDVKALMGDTSDNIPGVPGIGEKTALKIIGQYKSLEQALENYQAVKPERIGNLLNENRDLAIMSRELSTIVLDAPIDFNLKEITKSQIFNESFKEELKNLEFKSIIAKYFFTDSSPISSSNFSRVLIKSKEELEKTLAALANKKEISIALVEYLDEFVGLSFAADSTSFFAPFHLVEAKIVADLIKDKNLAALDSKKLLVYLHKFNAEPNIIFDAILGAYILNINPTIKDIGAYANIEISDEKELAGKGRSKTPFIFLPEETQLKYGAAHALIVEKTLEPFKKLLEEQSQRDLYYNIELPLAKVLASMEITGIKIDRVALVNFDSRISRNIDILTDEIYELAGEKFNINSPSQMGVILFEKLGLKGSKKTKTGYSTAADVLEKLRFSHPIAEKILEYRVLSKLKSTYCEGLLNVTNPKTDKIHSTFNQVITSTGRLSSTEPNLQNIPIRMELGRSLRKVFVPSEGYVFLDADYSQIELRILAHFSEDPVMIDAYQKGADIHRITASQVLGIPPELVSDGQRNSAKAVNFGIIYGMGAFSLSQDLKITKKQAEKYIASYFNQYPKVKAYLDGSVEFAKKNGYSLTIFGRRRIIPELKSPNFTVRSFGERAAMNMPIQGSAADIIKIAMVKVWNRLRNENLESRLILTVHDELLVEAKTEEADKVEILLKEEMEQAARLLVPLYVEVHRGNNWYEAK